MIKKELTCVVISYKLLPNSSKNMLLCFYFWTC